MSVAVGRHLCAIRSLDDIKQRCFVDEETGCWHMRMPNGKPLYTGNHGDVFVFGVGKVKAIRAAWSYLKGPIPHGAIVFRTCRSQDCCRPAHLRCGSRKDLGAWVRESGHARHAERGTINRLAAQVRRKVSDEMRALIAVSDKPAHELAALAGCSKTLVNQIKRGGKRRVVANSVFAWGGA